MYIMAFIIYTDQPMTYIYIIGWCQSASVNLAGADTLHWKPKADYANTMNRREQAVFRMSYL